MFRHGECICYSARGASLGSVSYFKGFYNVCHLFHRHRHGIGQGSQARRIVCGSGGGRDSVRGDYAGHGLDGRRSLPSDGSDPPGSQGPEGQGQGQQAVQGLGRWHDRSRWEARIGGTAGSTGRGLFGPDGKGRRGSGKPVLRVTGIGRGRKPPPYPPLP